MQDVTRDEYTISTDPTCLDLRVIHGFLAQSYWAEGIPMDVVRRSVDGSLNFGLYHRSRQVGFARVITDRATFAYVGDVFVLDAHRGKGLATWLMQTILAHPDLQGLRRLLLATRDAGRLYAKVGFQPLATPERYMEIHVPRLYVQGTVTGGNLSS